MHNVMHFFQEKLEYLLDLDHAKALVFMRQMLYVEQILFTDSIEFSDEGKYFLRLILRMTTDQFGFLRGDLQVNGCFNNRCRTYHD